MRHARVTCGILSLLLGVGSSGVLALPVGGPGPSLPAPLGTPLQRPALPGLTLPEPGMPSPRLQPLGRLIEQVPLPRQPLSELPTRLEVRDPGGRTLLVDVEVEGGWRAVEREWLLLLDEVQWQDLLREAPQLESMLVQRHLLPGLGSSLLRLRVPPELDSPAAVRALLPPRVRQYLDRNHVYAPQQGDSVARTLEQAGHGPVCPAPLRLGLIDTAIDQAHEVFGGLEGRLVSRDFLVSDAPAPQAHGTAIGALLVGRGPVMRPLLPQASLHAASVFYPQGALRQGATLLHLLQALEWLVSERVAVINMSLAGPDNAVLRQAVEQVLRSRVRIVAAAGNAGPAAPPQFPAAYPGVLAVTAVDADGQPYRWAGRGEHIAFAAPGVAVVTARAGGGYAAESGTSMAAPVVSAYLACALAAHGGDEEAALAELVRRARDLGEPGLDPVTGHGLLSPAAE